MTSKSNYCSQNITFVKLRRKETGLLQDSVFLQYMAGVRLMLCYILYTSVILQQPPYFVTVFTVTFQLLFTPWLITPLISHGQISLWEQSICPRLHSVPVGSKQAPLALRTRRQFNMGICGYVHRVPVNSNTFQFVCNRGAKYLLTPASFI